MAAILRRECHDGQNDPGIDNDKPAFYAGEANETDILAEGDIRGTVEEGGKGGAEAIANTAAAQLPRSVGRRFSTAKATPVSAADKFHHRGKVKDPDG